jgi:hypothetical protein
MNDPDLSVSIDIAPVGRECFTDPSPSTQEPQDHATHRAIVMGSEDPQ